MTADEIVERAALLLAEARGKRAGGRPLTRYDEALLDARAVLAEVAPFIESRALANAPDGAHCRSCCYLQAPCDEHKGGKL